MNKTGKKNHFKHIFKTENNTIGNYRNSYSQNNQNMFSK